MKYGHRQWYLGAEDKTRNVCSFYADSGEMQIATKIQKSKKE
jgi:hypothetical protein